jgi:type IV secretion system protein TrbL
MEFTALTDTLRNFVEVLDAGADRLRPYALGLLATLILIDVALTGSFTVLGEIGAAGLVKKGLMLGGWYYLTVNFSTIAVAFVDSLVKAGLIAGGKGNLNADLLLDPSRIAAMGLDVTEPILQNFNTSSLLLLGSLWKGGAGDVLSLMIAFGLSWVLMLAIYFAMALVVFLAVVEFHLALTVDGFLVPFGAWGPTRFIAEKAMGGVVSAGVKLMSMSLILAVTGPVLGRSITRLVESSKQAGGTITLNALLGTILTTAGVGLLAWLGPKWAASKAGGASLGGLGDVKRAVDGARDGAVTAATAGGGAALAATKAATYGVGAVSTGAKMGAALSSGGALSRFAGGLGGAARAGADALVYGVASLGGTGDKEPSSFAKGTSFAAGGTPKAGASVSAPGASGKAGGPSPHGPSSHQPKPSAAAAASTWSATTGGYSAEPPSKASALGGGKPIVIGSEPPAAHLGNKTSDGPTPPEPSSPHAASAKPSGWAMGAAGKVGDQAKSESLPPAPPASIGPPAARTPGPPPAVISPPAWADRAGPGLPTLPPKKSHSA